MGARLPVQGNWTHGTAEAWNPSKLSFDNFDMVDASEINRQTTGNVCNIIQTQQKLTSYSVNLGAGMDTLQLASFVNITLSSHNHG